MKKKIISASLAALVALGCTLGCKNNGNEGGSEAAKGDVKLYTDGMAYAESTAREEKEVYALYYEYLGGSDVMPIGGFYVPTLRAAVPTATRNPICLPITISTRLKKQG